MASFVRPFDPSLVTRVSPDVTITLPDPEFTPNDPIVRPHVARYAGATLTLLRVRSRVMFELVSPVTGAVRNVNLISPLDGVINQLLEISPLPFGIAQTLRELQPGTPTFYVGYARSVDSPPDDRVAAIGEQLAIVAADDPVYVGVLFQDRVALAPWAWIELIGTAMESMEDSLDAISWSSLNNFYTGERSLRVLDHVGRPANSRSFQIRIHRTDGVIEGPWTRTTGTDGDLEQAAIAAPLDRQDGSLQASLFGAPGEETELLWEGDAPSEDETLPIHALYADDLSTGPRVGEPPQPIRLPANVERGHLQTLELARWFAPTPAGVNVGRFHPNSRVEPLVDGVATFKRIVDDLLACTGTGNGAHMIGWAFVEFPLDDRRRDVQGNLMDTRINALAQHLIDNGGDIRFLVNKFITLKQDPDTEARFVALVVIVFLTSILLLARRFNVFKTTDLGFGVIGLVTLLLEITFSASNSIEELVEQSLEIFPILNDIRPGIAVWSAHPAKLDDNPVKITPITPLALENFLDQFGTWHQKLQCFKRGSDDVDGNRFIAYLGGIDINENRLDTPGHQILGPYHDVHARITGPGAADAFQTWDERWGFEHSPGDGSLNPVFEPPTPDSLKNDSTRRARQIVQIARTHYLRADGTSPFSNFAPDGERTIHDTLVRAIRAAREYIYIEDQYFVPNDRQNPASPDVDLPDTYLDALLEAANTCKRLIILMPSIASFGNQPFGKLRREHVIGRLRDPSIWGDRVLIGAPMRRPILTNPGRIASEGRCILMRELDELDSQAIIGPPPRVPLSDFYWLWIDGELMLTTSPPRPTTVNNKPAMEVDVMRGQTGTNRRWSASTRHHQKGAPVTMSQLKGIFVHAKIMMVDDVFVSIGSANINRRGLFYDGELNVFAVPEQLKGAPENPARALRTALWAEHLNLPPTMGDALFGDPIAGFDLFRRSPYAGNRFMPLDSLDLNPDLGFLTSDTIGMQLLTASGIALTNSLIETIWNDVTDPTSFIEPDPTPGPFPEF